jgi:diaminopimelate epimerase
MENHPSLPFVKMEAVGNDFVLLREADLPGDPGELAPRLCDRRFGIGGDGLLVLGESGRADFRMRMFNPDGTEDHCGNGMRCAFLYYAGEISAGEERRLTLETLDGVKRARVFREGDRRLAEVDMGEPKFGAADLPMAIQADRVVDYPFEVGGETVRGTVISTGTTHTVFFATGAEVEEKFERLSPLLESHPLFPERTSIMWATVEGRERIRLRIWERGANETLGCGTGACAAMVAARLHGYVGDRATIASKGGELLADWPGEGSCRLTGGANVVFKGTFKVYV